MTQGESQDIEDFQDSDRSRFSNSNAWRLFRRVEFLCPRITYAETPCCWEQILPLPSEFVGNKGDRCSRGTGPGIARTVFLQFFIRICGTEFYRLKNGVLPNEERAGWSWAAPPSVHLSRLCIYAVLKWHWKRARMQRAPTDRNQYPCWPTTSWPSFHLIYLTRRGDNKLCANARSLIARIN